MQIVFDEPDIMLFTEVIPKCQNPISKTQMKIKCYEIYKNFEYSDTNLGASGIRGVAICKKRYKVQRNKTTKYTWRSRLGGDMFENRSPTKEKTTTIETTVKVCEVIVIQA